MTKGTQTELEGCDGEGDSRAREHNGIPVADSGW